VDLTPAGVTGKDTERWLEDAGITVNKNAIPNDPASPFVTSGIRVGSPAMTTRGVTADEFREIGDAIARVVMSQGDEAVREDVRARMAEITAVHPLYPEL
jgi:glycine hydroxymethyltransferase